MILPATLTLRAAPCLPLLRLLSQQQPAASSPPDRKALLMRLRRESGYPFAKCKAALEQAGFDVDRAHGLLDEWAQEDGHSLSNRLAARTAEEGLLSIAVRRNSATFLEVNCETDFVAKNDVFKKFVVDSASLLANSINQSAPPTATASANNIDASQIAELADLKATTISLINENLLFGRWVGYDYPEDVQVFTASHPTNNEVISGNLDVKFGKFISLVAMKDENRRIIDRELANKIAYHIIAMQPKTLERAPKDVDSTEDPETEKSESQSEENEQEEEETVDIIADPHEESSEALLEQNFLYDSEKTVGDVCEENSIEIVEFHSFSMK